MNERAASGEHSQRGDTQGPHQMGLPDSEYGTDLPPHIASALKEGQKCLGVARSLLHCLSVASMYDDKIDASSAGVAEVACRLVDSTIKQLEPEQLRATACQREPRSARK